MLTKAVQTLIIVKYKYVLTFNLFLWWKSWIFSSHYSSIQFHLILKNSNMLLVLIIIGDQLLIMVVIIIRM